MDSIKVKFVDFWAGFDSNDNFLLKALRQKYDVIVLNSDATEIPEFVFCSEFGHEHFKYTDVIKIYFTGENNVPDFNLYDYAISFYNIDFDGRHIRYPLYLAYGAYEKICDATDLSNSQLLNRDFCSVVISNVKSSDPDRVRIWERVSEYKAVASGGKYKNNVGGPVDDKLKFIRGYKFNLALENSQVDWYTTEKIVEPLTQFTVPIYWGNSLVGKEFNKEAFIDISDFLTLERAIDYIRVIDNDDEAYLKMVYAPRLAKDNNIDWEERLGEFLCSIVTHRKKHVPKYGFVWLIQNRSRIKEYLHDRMLLRGMARRIIKKRGY